MDEDIRQYVQLLCLGQVNKMLSVNGAYEFDSLDISNWPNVVFFSYYSSTLIVQQSNKV